MVDASWKVASARINSLAETVTTVLYGQDGNDSLSGQAGDDWLEGGIGDDSLSGGDGNDLILGGTGNDVIDSGIGNDLLTGGGGRDRFVVYQNSGSKIVTDFGGIGQGSNPPLDLTAEADALTFEGDGLLASNMFLTQKANDLEITFDGIANTQVLLQNFALENLENLLQLSGSTVHPGNVLFEGEQEIQDSFDVFNADWVREEIFNHNTVTFLNDLNNSIRGFEDSDDVINGQGGDDTIWGLSGDDLLRGNAGNDTLLGGLGKDSLAGRVGNDTLYGQNWHDFLSGDESDDLLLGGSGTNTLVGGLGQDIFAMTGEGTDTVLDFTVGQDQLGLASGFTFDQLSITQGMGANSTSTWVKLNGKDDLLMSLSGVAAETLTQASFASLPVTQLPLSAVA